VDLALDVQPLATDPESSDQFLGLSGILCRVFEPSEDIEEPAKIATVVKTACNCAETLD
jgi:hypothetical protein